MKKVILIISLILLEHIAFSQSGGRFQSSTNYKPVNTAPQINWNYVNQQNNAARKRYENNKKNVNALINWIFEMKPKVEEKQFLDILDSYYKKLRKFDETGFAGIANDIRDIEFGIKCE